MGLSPQQRTLLETLIAFDTTSRNSNLDLIHHVANLLDGRARVTVDRSADGKKANLMASLGPDAPGGIVLAGHSDTVPVDGQHWDTDPYKAAEKDGRLYGRGACDMKGFCALALSQFLDMTGANLKKPLHLALTYDEETGCQGAFSLAANAAINAPDLVMIGEPTSLRPGYAHKGFRAFETLVQGLGAHSSNPSRGVNAIEHAARLVTELYGIARDNIAESPQDDRFDPPHVTLNIGTIEGGSAINVVADQCRFAFEMRAMAQDSGDKILKKFRCACDARKGSGCTATVAETLSVKPFMGDLSRPGSRLLTDLLGGAEPAVLAYFTEAGIYQDAGWNSVVCGPGSIAQAHQPNEYVDISQLESCADLLQRLTGKCL